MAQTPADPGEHTAAEPGSRRTATAIVVAFCLFAVLAGVAVRVVMGVLEDRWADEHAAACAGLRTWLESDRDPEDLVALRGATQDKWPAIYARDADGDLIGDDLGVRRTLAQECG